MIAVRPAEFLFGDEDALIQLDMSEFSESSPSRLFGSSRLRRYDEGGQLTEKARVASRFRIVPP